jgi:diguanylate cyclase (GGDEF)-like protein
LGERLRVAVAERPFRHNADPIQVTCSVGAAAFTGRGEEMVERADQAMYKAKQGGRNRVVVSDLTALASLRVAS